MNLLEQAPNLVARAVSRGLMSYPHGTQFTTDGRPIPKLSEVRYRKSPLEQYACLRAWEMSLHGISKQNIATVIRCPMNRIDQVLEHGKEMHKRKETK